MTREIDRIGRRLEGVTEEGVIHLVRRNPSRLDGRRTAEDAEIRRREVLERASEGPEPGAFTGASKNGKIGKFELAENGTVFLDEIGDLPLNLQVKLMRVLQEKEIEKIGGRPKKINFRITLLHTREI